MKTQPSQIVAVLNKVEELFPLPVRDNPPFKGNHSITLQDGILVITIWFKKGDRIMAQSFAFEDGETSIEEDLEEIKNTWEDWRWERFLKNTEY